MLYISFQQYIHVFHVACDVYIDRYCILQFPSFHCMEWITPQYPLINGCFPVILNLKFVNFEKDIQLLHGDNLL